MSYIVGLTGGIGSGKTTVSDYFKHTLNVCVVDADVVAREVVEPGTEVLKRIENLFGSDVIQPNGYLNRAVLRQLVFNNAEQRKKLEGITHPAIKKSISEQLTYCQTPYSILVVPLLLESDYWTSIVNRILVVDAEKNKQVERVSQRDSVTDSHVEKIIHAQMERHKRLQYANDIISNNGSLDALYKQVEQLHQCYLQFAANS